MQTLENRSAKNESPVAENATTNRNSIRTNTNPINQRPEAIAQRKLQKMANNPSNPSLVNSIKTALQAKRINTTSPSNKNAVIQRVGTEETGAYIGYTMGGDAPTFYFENGHFTQVHKNPENVGWHPNKSSRHFIKNITTSARNEYTQNRKIWDRSEKTAFGLEVESGLHDADEGNGMMVEGDVFTGQDGSEKVYLHPSRGRLIKPTDEDSEYSSKDAIAAASNGGLAKNAQ